MEEYTSKILRLKKKLFVTTLFSADSEILCYAKRFGQLKEPCKFSKIIIGIAKCGGTNVDYLYNFPVKK